MLIEITYNVTDVFMSTTETPVYVEISFEQPGSASAVWGSITGTLSNQTDLQNALNAKLDESTIDGGTEGQILSKASATDFDFAWINNYAKYLATNVRNQTGSTIGAFQVVYISGATGNKPLISLADADTEATSSKTYGVTATAIANNGTGDVVTAGELSGIDTSAFNEGDLLWLSTTAGGVVTTPPAEPAHAVFIGYVVRSHPTLGVIDVSIANGYELNELHGVQITTPTDNQGLFYNSTSTLWENKSITTALGYTPVPTTRNITINGVTYDLSADRTWTIAAGISGSGASGQVTYWTGASAVSGSNNLFWDNANSRLGIGTNAPNSAIEAVDNSASTYVAVARLLAPNTNVAGRNAQFYLGTQMSTGNSVAWNFYYAGNNSSANYQAFYFNGVLTPVLTMFRNGNVGINTSSDLGVKFGVYGDTLLRGSGATSATTALTVQNSSSANLFTVRNDGNVGIGTASPTASLFIERNQNGVTGLVISNNNAGTGANPYLQLVSDTTAGQAQVFKYSSGRTPYKTIAASDFGHYNATAGDISFLNDFASGQIKFAAGGASSPHLTIKSNGSVSFGADAMFWDNANSRLGIGTNTPNSIIHAVQTVSNINDTANGLRIATDTYNSTGRHIYLQNLAGTYWCSIGGLNGATMQFNSNVGIQWRYNNSLVSTFGEYYDGAEYASVGILARNSGVIPLIINGVTGQTADLFRVKINSTGSYALAVKSNGNVMLGGTTDLGVRLGVVGDTILRGSGATSATTALTVQNSSSTNLFTVRNDGAVTIQSVNSVAVLYMSANGDSRFEKSTSGTNGIQLYGPTSAHHTLSISSFNSDNYDNGALSSLRFNGNYVSSAGSTAFSYMLINGTINQTGTNTSIVRGLYVNNTLTAAANYRAIETARGNIVFGNLPTSSAGLPTGALWNDAGTVKIV